jgi:predicted transcriptional regulator
LGSEPLNKDQIGQKAKLTYAITQRALKELEGSLFISFKDEGRSKMYSLTESGRRLLEIYKKEKERGK